MCLKPWRELSMVSQVGDRFWWSIACDVTLGAKCKTDVSLGRTLLLTTGFFCAVLNHNSSDQLSENKRIHLTLTSQNFSQPEEAIPAEFLPTMS